MRPNTLAEAVERIQNGASQDVALAEFVDTFDLAPTSEARYATIEQEPALTSDKRIDALVGAIAEYLAKQRKLGHVPHWTSAAARYLDRPWHTCAFEDDAMREYLDLQQSCRIRVAQHFHRGTAATTGPRPSASQ